MLFRSNTTKEDDKERHPLEVLDERSQQRTLAKTVPQEREGYVRHDVEDDDER